MERRGNVLDPVHDVLPPIMWDNPGQPRPHLKKQHRDWIMREVMSLASKFEPNPEQWLTMVLTGSLTTFQYSDTSDCDVSLFVDPFKLPDWDRGKLIGLMVSKMDGTRLPGTPFEMQCFVVAKDIHQADLYQPGLRSGYDIKAQTWIVPPDPTRTHDVQREQNQDYIYALESADKMERLLRYEPDKAIQFWHQIHKRRMRDQKAGKGDYSQANIVYKFLANRGLFPAISQASGEYIARQVTSEGAILASMDRTDYPYEVRQWLHGGCADYALAMQNAAADVDGANLELGRHIKRQGDGFVTHHVFAHDDTHAYDALGAHPLPYKQEGWEEQYHVPYEDIEAEWNPVDEDIDDAYDHAFGNWQNR